VELVPDLKDRLAKRVRLTPEGAARQQEMLGLWHEAQDRFDRSFGREWAQGLRWALALISSTEFAESFQRAEENDVTPRGG
jgi:DNA-binding MarR family transcriptional regulator